MPQVPTAITDSSFGDMFFRRLVADCSIYLQCPQDVVQQHLRTTAQKRHLVQLQDEEMEDLSTDGVMPPSHWQRLRGYRQLLHTHLSYSSGVAAAKAVFVNLQQTACFHLHLSPSCPALLRASVLHDLVNDRPVLPLEHFLIHAFPVPGLVPPEFSVDFPFPGVLQTLSDTEVRKLTGNGMHLCAVGSQLMWLLAVARLTLPA